MILAKQRLMTVMLSHSSSIDTRYICCLPALSNSLWTLMVQEVLRYIMTAPYTFISGVTLLSELLPLPLPIQTRDVSD